MSTSKSMQPAKSRRRRSDPRMSAADPALRYPSRRPGYKCPYQLKEEVLLVYLPRGYRANLHKLATLHGTTMKAVLVEALDRHIRESPRRPTTVRRSAPSRVIVTPKQ